MSNIYVSEPPTKGKVVLNTSCGEISIELWSKEAPLACRNFIQLCLEGYYNDTIFHRLVKKFILQGGDPTGTGDGGESAFGQPFKIETHSRLRFNRRGLVAMHCVDNQVHGSQFFFTLNQTPELQNSYTIFGSVVGDTLYNMINLAEGHIDKDTFRPLNPKKVINTEVIVNPFSDIVPREKVIEESESEEEDNKVEAVDDHGLLSFGGELDDDDDDLVFKKKSKSAHDHCKHSNLSSEIVHIDKSEDVYEVGKFALVPTEKLEDPEEIKKKENLNELKKESERLKNEMVISIMKKQSDEQDELDNEIKEQEMRNRQENNGGKLKSIEMMDKFLKTLKNVQKNDWFFKQMSFAAVPEDDEVPGETKVIDPDVYNPDKYDLHDPRHPINQRKRQGPAADSSTPNVKEKRR